MDCTVNRKRIPGKFAFFCQMSGHLWLYPFIILYFKKLGLTTAESSIIFGFLPMFNAVFRIFVGSFADKFQKHREIVVVCALLSSALMSGLLFVPPVEQNAHVISQLEQNLTSFCHQNDSSSKLLYCQIDGTQTFNNSTQGEDQKLRGTAECKEFNSLSFSEVPECPEVTEILAKPKGIKIQIQITKQEFLGDICILNCTKISQSHMAVIQNENNMFSQTFWLVCCLYSVAYNLQSTIWGMIYAMDFAILGKARNQFGKQRMWGTIGAIVNSIITAFAMNKYGSSKSDINFVPCFIGFGVYISSLAVIAPFFRVPKVPINQTMAKHVIQILKQPSIFLVFVVLFIMGFLWGAIDIFLFAYLRELGASSWVLGASLFVSYTVELPALFMSGWVLKRIGHVKCLYIVLIAYSVRYLGTSFITNPWWELPFSCLKSIVFSIGFTAVAVYTSKITPPSMHATLQTMVQVTHFGFGRGVGILAFGSTMETLGSRWSFRVGSIIAIVTCIVYAILQHFMPPAKFVNEKDDTKDDKDVDKDDEEDGIEKTLKECNKYPNENLDLKKDQQSDLNAA